jgi:predicted nucleic acid-binding protein
MPTGPSIRVVIDTNVLFEGLTRRGGATGLVVEAWLAGLLSVYVSNALAYEYTDVLSRKLSKKRWAQLQPVLGRLLVGCKLNSAMNSLQGLTRCDRVTHPLKRTWEMSDAWSKAQQVQVEIQG